MFDCIAATVPCLPRLPSLLQYPISNSAPTAHLTHYTHAHTLQVAAVLALCGAVASGELPGAAAWLRRSRWVELSLIGGDLATTFVGLHFVLALTKVAPLYYFLFFFKA